MLLFFSATSAWAAKSILVFGDSLSAGYGMQPEVAWPALLQVQLAKMRLNYIVANRSLSGETTAGGRSHLEKSLKEQRPAVVILELGANDGLRGLSLAQMKDNLNAMIEAAQATGARVLLLGMRLPPNYGAYAAQFHATFAEVAKRQKIPLVDFFLTGIADQPALLQPDGLHPTAEAQPHLLDNIWPTLMPLLK